MGRNYDTRKIKTRRSYSPKDIAKLFSIDKKTCFRWIIDEGLEVMQKNSHPLLIMGYDLKKFIEKRQARNKVKLKSNEYYCVKCRKPVLAVSGSERTKYTGKSVGKSNRMLMNKSGICCNCGTKTNKFM